MKSLPKKESKEKSFTIVAIGASAGGLEAMTSLLQNLSPETGMAYIYAQHLSPDHPSALTSLLSKTTNMKVQEIEDMDKMKPDNVYVIPPDRGIEVTDGRIKVVPRSKSSTAVSIDALFSTLAETHKANVIGIVLSGNASDGTEGLKAIKKQGGITFAQDDTAKFKSMPQSAVASGNVDFVLSPMKIAGKLNRINNNGLMQSDTKRKQEAEDTEVKDPDLKTIFGILHKKTGVDFSHYKINTIKRRVHRRMLHYKIKTIQEYVKLVMKDNKEVDMLHHDLLIPVTNFFRDIEVFRYLKTTFLPKLLSNKSPDESLRIWVIACSTGEEAYSLAMLITEIQENKSDKIPVQIFATDLSAQAIRKARIGEYSGDSLKSVGKKRMEHFFTKKNGSYLISKNLREMCVFAPHNILRDPPFSRMDFISCRNLLIYFDTAAQKKALATFHFALNEGGYLLLGKAETIGTSPSLFTTVNNKYKLYSRKKNTVAGKPQELTPRLPQTLLSEKNLMSNIKKDMVPDSNGLQKAIDNVLHSHYMPACAIINQDMEILEFRGSTEMFLKHSSGKASFNILKMARPEFAFELRSVILKAFKTKQTIRKSGIEIKLDSAYQTVSIEASPLKIEWDEPLLIIVFSKQEQIEKYIEKSKGKKRASAQKDLKVKNLIEELNTARAEMHSIIESQETANEELQSANEEIVSSNEELQTLNEELETSKEEIEATNEELTSTNQELQMRNEQLAESYAFSEATLEAIHEKIVILDKDLRIKSANKAFYKKFHVDKNDTEGHLIYDLGNGQWNIPQLRGFLETILPKNSHFDDFEMTHLFPKIGKRTFLLNARRIEQKTRNEQLILLAMKDITEIRKRVTEPLQKKISKRELQNAELEKIVNRRTRELKNKNEELENAVKDLTTFNYISSHDLQEPLRKMQNFVSVLLKEEEKKLSRSGKDYLNRADETAKRMQMLIEDLLTYSRTGKLERKLEETDLNIILNEVKKDFEETIRKKKATIEASELCHIYAIPFQVRQLLHNLISNSLKFSNPRKAPRIIIRSKIMPGSKLNKKQLSPKINYCHLTFTDNGIGFDPKYKDRIFEVFQRLHEYDKYKGTGIGLAICKRIVENHNGIITATGKLNKGAQFDLYFPSA